MWVSENAVYPPLMVNKKKRKNRSTGKVIEITWQRASSFTFTIHDPEMAGMKPPKLEVSWVFRSRKHHKFWEAPHLLENWSTLRLRNPQLLPAGGVPAQKAG